MALSATHPTAIAVKRLRPSVGDGGGGAVDAGTSVVHTYTGQVIIPRSRATVREEKSGGVVTTTYRYVHLAHDDNVSVVNWDVRIDDAVTLDDGKDYLVREVVQYSLDGSLQLYVFNEQ